MPLPNNYLELISSIYKGKGISPDQYRILLSLAQKKHKPVTLEQALGMNDANLSVTDVPVENIGQ